ncbi:RagB/SusD family nutrient uptake outer membrane protein [Hymenobacter sp. BT507]|uniref:RagB/SusD family nutrient uptake outer membrane protein n=1 Tax=Hymenobacter citatus TaxID=2763506 RepID=A0ABR7MNB2_9BACT|nr:RagB/SusD family nutrient uptake outer membrane protein [Hymenobacter citatus]MBC6612577.1 RagB/SusD family nutrient uptake outer membrane protein [Hymenobacter citatus]
MKIITKNTVTVALGALLLATGVTSCDTDKLDPVPETAFSDQVVFNTPARIALQINNLYAYVKSGSFLGGRYQVYSDVRADDFINRTSNAVTALQVWNHTLTETSSNDVTSVWGAAYSAINQINVFLAGLEANSASYVAPVFAADFATTTAVQYQAEARFLRALSYYSLLQLYARPYIDGNGSKPGLPLRLQAETGAGGNDLARSTVGEVYAQILEDLNFAEKNLPLTYASTTLNITRAHRNTAIALKTRVYLTMGQYANVVTEANKIVPATAPFTASSGVANSLNASIVTVFNSETTESILAFPFTAQNTPGTQNQLGFYYLPTSNPGGPTGGGEFYLNAEGILANTTALSATDVRRTSFVITNGGNSYLAKYSGGTPYLDKAPVLRYPEVMLSLSEALFRTNGPADTRALALLNAVRTRSKGTAYTSFASADAAVNAVLLERRIEFLGEGIRNIDIMRLNATIPGKGSVSAVPSSSANYVWPIPATELQTNSLITRN